MSKGIGTNRWTPPKMSYPEGCDQAFRIITERDPGFIAKNNFHCPEDIFNWSPTGELWPVDELIMAALLMEDEDLASVYEAIGTLRARQIYQAVYPDEVVNTEPR